VLRALTVVVLLAGILFRWINLDADPESQVWNGYITDEGRWIAHARAIALFGSFEPLVWHLHLHLAPLFQAATLAVFETFGVSILTSRLLPALCSTALLLAFWSSLRRVVPAGACLAALTLLALQPELLVLGRVAVPDVPAMALHFLAFVVLMAENRQRSRLGLGALLLVIGVATKATTLPAALILALVAVLVPAGRAQPGGGSQWRTAVGRIRPRWALMAVAGAAAAVVVTLAALAPSDLRGTVRTSVGFLQVASPYEIVSAPFRDRFAPTLNSWLLLVWLGAIGWIASRPSPRSPAVDRWYGGSAVWLGLYTVVMVVAGYSPPRFKMHVLVPMAVNIAAGLALFERAQVLQGGWHAGPPTGRYTTAVAVHVLLALPAAVLFAPIVAAIGSGGAAPTLLGQLGSIGVGLAAAVPLSYALGRRGRTPFVILFPLAAVFLTLLLDWSGGADRGFWIAADAARHAAWWALVLGAAAVLAAAVASVASRRAVPQDALVAAVVIALVPMSLATLAPAYASPRFTMRDASRDLGGLLGDERGIIATSSAESLFTGTSLRYRTITGLDWPWSDPDALVVAYVFDDGGRLDARYALVREYFLHVSPEFYDTWPALASQPRREHVRVYRKVR
jgi:hypothetical protein